MLDEPALLLTKRDIASLAGGQRPVVSVWRTRYSGTGRPFPQPVRIDAQQEKFAAAEVIDWLRERKLGNNDTLVRKELSEDTEPIAITGRADTPSVRLAPDGTHLDLKLRGDVTFHDGTPLRRRGRRHEHRAWKDEQIYRDPAQEYTRR
ncbi:MAG: hypothetical protein GXY65_02470 [Rhodococcus sp.]|uniref:hypothetical protein n=1 Tax=Rhodococcus sp. TaxID=1831 RepID=UPI0016B240ED|nr:hypothetical protein [Rhodococcus sp. (in: high G+C Gram-positive bacteria)]NLV78207.1 hypothetical protein [Rhodococcus sp. (in: high G+C Gram-positive bacteria)]